MKLSCGLAPGPESLSLAVLAEELGYERVWLFDSAPIWEDVFVHLGLVATATQRIGLGTAVLVPTQRSVMTTASAIATIERLAPRRTKWAFGTGFTAARCMAQKPMPMAEFGHYLRTLRALLAGETVEIEGQRCRMMHWDGMALPRPVPFDMVVSAFGPRGIELSNEIGDGRMALGRRHPGDKYFVQMYPGTVLEEGEDPRSDRALDAVAPWLLSATYHGAWEAGTSDELPLGAAWRAGIEAEAPEGERHLLVHEGHCTHVTPRDEMLLPVVPYTSRYIGTARQLESTLQRAAAAGIDELIYTPAGRDMAGELHRFRSLLDRPSA